MIDRKRSLKLIKDELTAKRDELSQRIEQRRNEIAVDAEPDDEGARAVDQASRDFAAFNLEREMQTLAEIQSSLRRLTNGNYGVCNSCGEEIPIVRLQALPWARLCLNCASGTRSGVSRHSLASDVRGIALGHD
jgi:RNA polymerase-binding transcription factor